MAFGVPDEVLGVLISCVVYWLYSGMYELMGPMEKHRLFPAGEEVNNLVSKRQVVLGVLLEQAMQIAIASLLTFVGKGITLAAEAPSLLVVGRQLLVALLVMDAWQYWWHRFMHLNKFMYKHIHAVHHRVLVPYAYGATYNHLAEGFILHTVGVSIAVVVSGLSPWTSCVFLSLASIKNVDDHCGLWFPSHPFHRFFRNNAAFHAIHHQLYGNKYNFSAPFLVMWDKLMGTYLPHTVEERKGGGYEIRPWADETSDREKHQKIA